MEAGQNCLMGHIQYAEHPLHNLILQMLAASSMELYFFFLKFHVRVCSSMCLWEEGLEQPRTWHLANIHCTPLAWISQHPKSLLPCSKSRVFPKKSLAHLSVRQWWRQVETSGDGFLPSGPTTAVLLIPHGPWSLHSLRVLQTWATFGLKAETEKNLTWEKQQGPKFGRFMSVPLYFLL